MTRTRIIAGNWKMNGGASFLNAYSVELGALLQRDDELTASLKSQRIESVLFVPAPILREAKSTLGESFVAAGAQNAHHEPKGAFTGEISGPMLTELGIEHVLIGHSERRQFFGETEASAAQRAVALLKQGLRVMFCIGETLAEREAHQTERVLEKQLSPLWNSIQAEPQLIARLSIAYEPVWAIGTGRQATPEQAQEIHTWIRAKTAESLRILHGGSVTPESISDLLARPDIDGCLAGGASLKATSYLSLLQAAQKRLSQGGSLS